MRNTLFALFALTTLTGCLTIEREDVVGFGDREVLIKNLYPFNANILINETLYKSEVEPGYTVRYIQPQSDTNKLFVKLVSAADPSHILTNVVILGSVRSFSSWAQDTEYHKVVASPPVEYENMATR
jgi:hypothetical protein